MGHIVESVVSIVEPFELSSGCSVSPKRIHRSAKVGSRLDDAWYRMADESRRECLKAHLKDLEELADSPFESSGDKLRLVHVFEYLGLSKTYDWAKNSYRSKELEKRPGCRVNMGEVYRRVVKDFLEGRWGHAVDFVTEIRGLEESRAKGVMREILGRVEQGEYTHEEVVAWVSEHLLADEDLVSVESIPNGKAYGLWRWAKRNEDSFRKLFECKRGRVVSGARVEEAGNDLDDDAIYMAGLMEE